ncbi:MAG: cyclic nucleotide-binding domain-containing protein [Cellvibrionaceae bacterium]
MKTLEKVSIKEALRIINKIPFFASFSEEEKLSIANQHSKFLMFEPHEIIIRENEPGDSFYVLLTGNVNVIKMSGSVLASLGPGECFGEMAYLTNQHRSTGVVADSEPVVVLQVDKGLMDVLNPTEREKIKDKLLERLVERIQFMNKLIY